MMLNKLKNIFMTERIGAIPFYIGDIVLLLTKNLIVPGIFKFQPWFMGPFWVMFTGPGTYHLDLPPRMSAIHPWFYTSLLKPAGPQPAGPYVLEDNSYEDEAIFQINKHRIHAKVKWMILPITNGFGSLSCKALLLKWWKPF